MSTLYTVGQMNQLGDALEAADFTPEDVTKLRTSPQLHAFKQVLLGHAEIKQLENVIDLDASPICPGSLTVEEHQKGGSFRWDPAKVQLYLSKPQSKGKVIGGLDLRKDLVGKPVFNACLLDYLLAHPHLIPEEWKGKCIFFWGTIYRDSDGRLFVRCLYWRGGQWQWNYYWLGLGWYGDDPAALRAS
ncbi:MAG: hypothetical protein Q8O51_01880 [bacterium]|nr:hypothetical protein [bacterium]